MTSSLCAFAPLRETMRPRTHRDAVVALPKPFAGKAPVPDAEPVGATPGPASRYAAGEAVHP